MSTASRRRISTSSSRPRNPPDGSSERTELTVGRSGVRLDRLVADELGCGRRAARAWIRSGSVLLDGRAVSGATLVRAGQRVVVAAGGGPWPPGEGPPRLDEAPDAAAPELAADALRLLWEDGELLVLSKPTGVHTHGGRSRKSVATALAEARPELASVGPRREAGVVHRLDRDTSGVLLVAKHAGMYETLRAAFKAGRVTKRYLALVAGDWEAARVVDRPLARRRTRVVPARRGDRALKAVSAVVPIERTASWSLVGVTMATGVTHQVRAHLALSGHPILGDLRYGGPPSPRGSRAAQLLHAMSIALPDGRSFAAAVPADFVRALWSLRREAGG